jgi:hypothetical protein
MNDTVKRSPGRPKLDAKTVPIAFRLDEVDKRRIPLNAKGKPDQEWIRGAILARLEAEGL